MTTIIAVNTPDDQAIYTDSLSEGAGISTRGNSKSAVIAPGCVMGWCGTRYVGTMAARALQERSRLGTLEELFLRQYPPERLMGHEDDMRDFTALFLFLGRIWVMHDECCPITMSGHYAARGSGAHFALGALAAGVTPWQALTIASQYDCLTGAPFFRLDISGTMVEQYGKTMEAECYASA